MPIAWRTDYAIRIMYEIARRGPGTHASISVISESATVPYDFARQIANHLVHEGLLVSKRGAHGGFALARSAARISVLDIFRALGETPSLARCFDGDSPCVRADSCPVHHGLWLPLDEVIERELGRMTLAVAVEQAEAAAFGATATAIPPTKG